MLNEHMFWWMDDNIVVEHTVVPPESVSPKLQALTKNKL